MISSFAAFTTDAVANSTMPDYAFIACDVETFEITKFNAAGEATWIYSEALPIDAWPNHPPGF